MPPLRASPSLLEKSLSMSCLQALEGLRGPTEKPSNFGQLAKRISKLNLFSSPRHKGAKKRRAKLEASSI